MPCKLRVSIGTLLSLVLILSSPLYAADWSNAYESGDLVYDLSQLPLSESTPSKPWTLEPNCSSVNIDTSKPSTTVSLNLPLPNGTLGVGLWIMADSNAIVSFQISDGKQTIQLQEGQLQNQTMTSRQSGMTTVFKDWKLRRAHLLSPSDNLILKSITIKQRQPQKSLQLGCVLASIEGADPYRATRVWKLKDFVTPKPNSLNWTAIDYHEYGFGTDTVIRPDVFKQILHTAATQHVRIGLTDSFKRAIQTWWQRPGTLNQGMTLPNLPKGCYFLNVDRFDSNGYLLGSNKLVYQVLRDDVIATNLPLTEVENAQDPIWMDGYVAA